MTAADIVKQLKKLGSASTQRILKNHGAEEPVLGVKIGDLKKIQKQTKTDYALALELFDTGIYDAQYLAGLITDDAQMTKKDLRHWLATANGAVMCGTMVAPVAAGSKHGLDLALKWIEAKKENTAQTGWMTLCNLVSITPDDELDLPLLKKLLKRVGKSIHQEPNRVRYAMNQFVIATGCFVSPLTELALETAAKIGTVTVDMGNTACEVPDAVGYIQKVQKRGTIGKKRKTAKC